MRSQPIQIIDSTDTGLFKARAVIGRVGVQKYLDGSGQLINVYRDPEIIQQYLNTFDDLPVTLEHPQNPIDYGNTEPVIGYGSKVSFENGLLTTDITVLDKSIADSIREGSKYLSIGYSTNLADSEGVWVDTEGWLGDVGTEYQYNLVQSSYRGNHISVVDSPRAGKIATFILDSIDAEIIMNEEKQSAEEQNNSEALTQPDFSKELESFRQEFKDSLAKLSEYFTSNQEVVTDSNPQTPDLTKAAVRFYTEVNKFASLVKDSYDVDYDKDKASLGKELLELVGDSLPSDLSEAEIPAYLRGYFKAYKPAPKVAEEEDNVTDSQPSLLSTLGSSPSSGERQIREVNGTLIY